MAGAVDTNGPWLAERLATIGIEVRRIILIGDQASEIRGAFQESLKRTDLVITTGGLGPTGDDLTRETVANALGLPLKIDRGVLESIREAFASRRIAMPQNNRVQALVPKGASVLPNLRGTAPGLIMRKGKKVIVVLPGPPNELKSMAELCLFPFLTEWMPRRGIILTRIIKVWGVPESAVDEKLRDLFAGKNPVLGLLASQREIKVTLTARGATQEEVERLLKPVEREVKRRLGRLVFGRDDDTMEAVVGRLLSVHKFTLAVAESCTGGLIGHKLTNVPGSSAYFERGVVTYSDQAKTDLLKIPKTLMGRHGAVSAQVAEAMAKGIRKLARTTFGLSVTGIAGPTGATAAKPVGLVYIALAGSQKTRVEKLHFRGTRDFVKERAAQSALDLLRRTLS